MRIVLSFFVVLALIGASLGCWSTEWDNPSEGNASIPVRHHGGEHFKVQDYTQISKFYEKMASGELTTATLTLADLPPAMCDMSPGEFSQIASGTGGLWYVHQYCTTFDNTDPSNPANTLVNPSVDYLLELANPMTRPTPFQPYNLAVNGMNMIGNPGYEGTGSNVKTQGTFYLAGIVLNTRDNVCDFIYPPNVQLNTHDYNGDGYIDERGGLASPDWPFIIGLLNCWTVGNTPVNFDGWGYDNLTISGNSSIKDSDGNTIDSVQDLVNHVVQNGKFGGHLGLHASLQRVSIPDLGTLQLRRPFDMELGSLSGQVNFTVNENLDLVKQFVGHLERTGYRTGDTIDLGGMTLDFGDFTVTMPEQYAQITVLMDSMKRLIAECDQVSPGDRGFSRDRMRVR